MPRRLATCLPAALAAYLLGPLAASCQPKPLVLAHVTVIDATGAPAQPDMTVVIADGRIVSLGKSGSLGVPTDAQVVPAAGKFLIPGLWDMHVHLSWTKVSALPALVANGVTGVRDMGGILKEIDEWRGQVAAGTLAGPRVLRAGPTLNGKEFAYHQVAVTTEAEARAAVRILNKVGVDFIKIHRAFQRDAYFGLADESKKLGIRFAGHIPQTVTPAEASDAGQASFEHTETLFEGTFVAQVGQEKFVEALGRFKQDGAKELFARMVKNGTSMTPTLVAYRSGTEMPSFADPRDKYISASSKAMTEKVMEKYKDTLRPEVFAERKRVFREFIELVGMMHRDGVNLLAGTDIASRSLYPGFSLHEELALLVEAGLPPMSALQAATRNPAAFLKLDHLGTVEQGKTADLVLLDASPLEDIRNTTKIHAVIVNGRFLDRARLDSLLAEAEALAKKN